MIAITIITGVVCGIFIHDLFYNDYIKSEQTKATDQMQREINRVIAEANRIFDKHSKRISDLEQKIQKKRKQRTI